MSSAKRDAQSPAAPRPSDAEAEAVALLASQSLRLLAHELRTPLAAIAALAAVMRDEQFGALGDARYRGYAGDIHDSAIHALEVLAATLEQPDESAASRLPEVALDAAQLVQACVSLMRPLAERGRITITAEVGDGLRPLRANARALRQVLLNLIANAFRFTPAGGTVTVAARSSGDGSVRLSVSDTGTGMTAAALAGRGARAGSNGAAGATAKTTGNGLGLPLARALCAQNGGRLEIDSREGQGTTVSMVFAAP